MFPAIPIECSIKLTEILQLMKHRVLINRVETAVHISQRTDGVRITNANPSVLYIEIIAVYFENQAYVTFKIYFAGKMHRFETLQQEVHMLSNALSKAQQIDIKTNHNESTAVPLDMFTTQFEHENQYSDEMVQYSGDLQLILYLKAIIPSEMLITHQCFQMPWEWYSLNAHVYQVSKGDLIKLANR